MTCRTPQALSCALYVHTAYLQWWCCLQRVSTVIMWHQERERRVWSEDSRRTLRASRSLSRLWPMRMDSALNMLSSTAWTSLSLMVALSRSSSVTPENLTYIGWCHADVELRSWRLPVGVKLTSCCSRPLCSRAWRRCRRWLSALSRWRSPWSAPGPASCSTETKANENKLKKVWIPGES